MDTFADTAPGPAGVGSWLGVLDWEGVREQVARESQARIVVAGPVGAGKTSLLARLQGWPGEAAGRTAAGTDLGAAPREDLGGFVALDLPGEELDEATDPWPDLAAAELVLFLVDAGAEPDAGTRHWLAKVRSLGRPYLVAASKLDTVADQEAALRHLERCLASPVLGLSTRGAPGCEALLRQVVAVSPAIAVTVGREVPAARGWAARRLIQRATLVTGLAGAMPVPLIDLAVQVDSQMRLLTRLATVYGQGGASDGSREIMASVAGALLLRAVLQQLAKLIPVVGWAASGFLSAATTTGLGLTAVAHYQGRWAGRRPSRAARAWAALRGRYQVPRWLPRRRRPGWLRWPLWRPSLRWIRRRRQPVIAPALLLAPPPPEPVAGGSAALAPELRSATPGEVA